MMTTMEELLDEVFAGQERVSRDEVQRRAVAADLDAADLTALDSLPEGEYSQEEVADALGQRSVHGLTDDSDRDSNVDSPGLMGGPAPSGVDAADLEEEALLRELASLHRTRHDTLLHASSQALQRHSERTAELELEYLRRHPERDIDADRLRAGARQHR